MTDTDTASLMFVIILDKSFNLGEKEIREVMLKVVLGNDIYYRIDYFHEFFEQFEKRNDITKFKENINTIPQDLIKNFEKKLLS